MTDFLNAIATLERYYGRPKPAVARGPFELILYENIAYLVSEDRREKAFRELKARIGTRPEDILVASLQELAAITALGGIFPELRARRLQEAARLVRDEFRGDLKSVLALDFVKARKALRKFPVIGDPGAEKIFFSLARTPVSRLNRTVSACWCASASRRSTRAIPPPTAAYRTRSGIKLERNAPRWWPHTSFSNFMDKNCAAAPSPAARRVP